MHSLVCNTKLKLKYSIIQYEVYSKDMKKLLLLGAVFPFCDLYDDICSLGYDAVVCDYYPDAPCKAKAKISCDISTTDVAALIEVAKRHNVTGIVSAFSDRNLMPGYEIAKALGLPTIYTPEIISLLTEKSLMKAHFVDNGFPVIPYKIVSLDFSEDDLKGLNFPVVVKPVDGYGSKGIIICDDIKAIRAGIDRVTKEALKYKGNLLIEELYNGDELTLQGWVKDGRVFPACIF